MSSAVLPQNEATGFAEISLLETLRLQPVILWVNADGGSLATGIGSFIGFLVFGKVDENLIFSREIKALVLDKQKEEIWLIHTHTHAYTHMACKIK